MSRIRISNDNSQVLATLQAIYDTLQPEVVDPPCNCADKSLRTQVTIDGTGPDFSVTLAFEVISLCPGDRIASIDFSVQQTNEKGTMIAHVFSSTSISPFILTDADLIAEGFDPFAVNPYAMHSSWKITTALGCTIAFAGGRWNLVGSSSFDVVGYGVV